LRTKFILRGRVYNIPGLEDTNREETEVCIAFIHRKSGEFSCNFKLKPKGNRSLSLRGGDGIALKSVMDFDMASFHPLFMGWVKFEFKQSNNRIKFKSNFELRID
jgi:hypothetical protein